MATAPASVPFANGVLSSVPTLGEWAKIAFVTLLMGFALWFNGKQRLMVLAPVTGGCVSLPRLERHSLDTRPHSKSNPKEPCLAIDPQFG